MLKTTTKQTLKIYWRHTRPYLAMVLVVFLAILASSAADLYKPFLYKQLFDMVADRSTPPQDVLNVVWILLAISLASWAFYRFLMYYSGLIMARVMSNLANTCFKHIHNHSVNFFSNSFVGSLVKKVGRFTRSYNEIADQLSWALVQSTIRIIAILVVFFLRHWMLGTVLLVWSILFILFNVWFARYKMKYDLKKADADTETAGHLADTISNNINLKLFQGDRREYHHFTGLTDNLFRWQKKTWDLDNLSDAIQTGLMVLLEFAVLYVAVGLWADGSFSIGDFALIQGFLLQLFDWLWGLGKNIRRVYSALADAEDMTEILESPHEVKDRPGATKLLVSKGLIKVSGASFSYGDHDIFRDFSLKISPGEKVALVGASGSGKSTIIKLLLRFYDIQQGKVEIDGQDINRVTQESLRANISLVPQDPVLFHRSLMENIRYAKPDATNKDVINAAKLAHCHEFIGKFSEGYDTYVGERGVKLSGGERQRVAIARAILKDAPILILDEATSSLDSLSEHLIQDALKNLMKGKTAIVVAHRLSTVMQMDRILVLEEGKVIEEGTHSELVKSKDGKYQQFWQIQAGGFA